MVLKAFTSKRRLIVAAIILLAGVVAYEKWHRAGIVRHHYPPTVLTRPAPDPGVEFTMTNKNYEANVDLWANLIAPVYNTDISYANYVFQSALQPEDLSRLVRTTDDGASFTLPVTMSGQNIDYAHFSIGNFKANLTLTPTKAKPDDLIPTQLKPGVGGSFDF